MPIDAWKTTKQVEGADGLKRLIEKTKKHPTALWQGALGAMSAAAMLITLRKTPLDDCAEALGSGLYGVVVVHEIAPPPKKY
eukprot:1404918-Amphidinium_carterae.1